ncbi:MAG TPA: hypothetical protein VJC07_02380 [Candidatus Nanoarchaeia archaeon]|nr:hypothetical protein [Candidatus Nanoarchaeia archaeon]
MLVVLSISVSAQVLTFEAQGNSIAMNGMNVAEAGEDDDFPSPNLMASYSLGSGKTGTTASAPSKYSSTGALMQFDFGEGTKWNYLSSIERAGTNHFEDKTPVAVSWELPLLVSQDWKPVSYNEGLSEIPEGQDVHFILNGKLKLPGKFVIYSAEGDKSMAEAEIKDANADCSSPNSRCSATLITSDLPPGYYYLTYSDQNVQISAPMALKIGDPKDKGESTIVLKDPATGKSTVLKWTPKVTTATYVKGNVNNQKITVIDWRGAYPSGISIGTSTKNVVYDLNSLGLLGLTFEVATDWKTYTALNFNNGNVLTFTKDDDSGLKIASTGDWGNSGLTATTSSDGKSFVLTGEKKAQLTTTLEEDCTPETIARLNKEKAELEKMVADLEGEERGLLDKLESVNSDLSAMNEQKTIITSSISSLSSQITDLQTKAQQLDQKKADLTKSIEKMKKRMDELTRILADAEGLGVHSGGGDPLGGMDSGGAVSYDGGNSWITFKGNAGAEKFLERMQKLKEIKKELLDLSRQFADMDKERQSIENQQKDMESKKSSLEKDLADKQKELSNLEGQIEGKEAEKQQLSDKLDELAKSAKDLNDMVKAFNDKARKCGIEAHGTFIDALAKLKKMPPGMQQKTRVIFDGQATEEEKDVLAKSGYVADSKSAEVITAADKLTSSMKEASNCKDGETMKGELNTYIYEFTLHGVDRVWIADWQGVRGLKMSEQQEAFEEISKGISVIDTGDLGLDIIDLLQDANPVGLIYSFGFQDPAVNAIMGQIKNWISQGALAGPPLWIQVGYGKLWDQDIKQTTNTVDVYKCVEGIWQYSNTEKDVKVERSACSYTDGGVHEYEVPLEELDWTPGSGGARGSWNDEDAKKWAGKNPQGWSTSFNAAIREAFDEKLKGYVIGKCE